MYLNTGKRRGNARQSLPQENAMKKFGAFIGIAALLLAMIITIAGCDDPNSSSGGGTNGSSLRWPDGFIKQWRHETKGTISFTNSAKPSLTFPDNSVATLRGYDGYDGYSVRDSGNNVISFSATLSADGRTLTIIGDTDHYKIAGEWTAVD
jgi:hypothetical protein